MTDVVTSRSRQARSLESASRLLDAAEGALRESDFAATSLSDIARRAGMTTGAVYSSFANKAALFAALETKVCEEIEADAERAFTGPPCSASEFAETVVRAIIVSYASKRGGLRALALAARQDAQLAARVAAVNRRILDRFGAALRKRLKGSIDSGCETAGEIGFLIVTSALRETIVFETDWPVRGSFDQDRLAIALAAVLAFHIEAGAAA